MSSSTSKLSHELYAILSSGPFLTFRPSPISLKGGFNRVLQATFKDGYSVLARIPYNSTVPRGVVVASEAATLGLLRSRNIPVPRVLGYSQDHKNPAGAAYLLLERLDGAPLGDQ